MDNLKLISYNCRGLNNTKKRRDVFDFLKTKQAHIYCLQDCHFTPDMKNRIYSEWDGECYFSFGQSNSRGICVLFKKNLPITVNKIENDSLGNYLLLDLTYMTNSLTLCTLYGPNKDTPTFFYRPL